MKTVGITGGIGSGKSIIGKVLTVMGFPVFYSDQEGKRLMTENQTIIQQIEMLFGSDAYTDNQLNRAFIASQIFKDESLKEQLNQIIHPAVRARLKNWAQEQSSPLVFNEAAILFETGSYKDFDYTILVTASKETRILRIIKRDKSSREEILDRMNNQWKDEEKAKLASFMIVNNDKELVLPQLEAIIDKIS